MEGLEKFRVACLCRSEKAVSAFCLEMETFISKEFVMLELATLSKIGI